MQELGDVDIGGKFTAGVADISEQLSGAGSPSVAKIFAN
jgi:hypothetical protein